MMTFEQWFNKEVLGGRLYWADEEEVRTGWNAAVEECAKVCDEEAKTSLYYGDRVGARNCSYSIRRLANKEGA
jgi:hypothetical protein